MRISRTTLRVLREARYDNIYMFKYSPRPGTPAFAMEDTLPEEVLTERFDEASRVQREVTGEPACGARREASSR